MMKNKLSWNLKYLIAFHLAALLLLISWIFPPFSTLWDWADLKVFQVLNKSLKEGYYWQLFWGLLNAQKERIFSLFFLGFATFYFLMKIHRKQFLERFFHMMGYFTFVLFSLLLTRLIMHNMLHLRRLSPSLVFEDSLLLSQMFPYFAIKDSSIASFPGDHTTVLLLWGGYLWKYSTNGFKIFILTTVTLFSLPRLVAGAHWLTDDLVGSVLLFLIIFSWSFYAPFAQWLAQIYEGKLQWLIPKRLTKNY